MITTALTWDIFCRVIDNHGDLGVCWRLSADLAQRGQSVRLWVDDASALAWMAPQNYTGVEVRTWPNDAALQAFAQDPAFAVGNVVVEAFGCELPEAFQALMVRGTVPVWINLEYLSAEAYVARSHGLASPVMSGPARGTTKWFYFPGFTPDTGGLLREPHLQNRQAAFDRAAWLKALPLDKPIGAHEQLISLFCYEPVALPEVLQGLSQADQSTRLLVTQGRPSAAVAAATQALNMPTHGTGRLHISQLPYLSQTEFDHLLWACDLNFVRGEDSLVRALWAGKPFVWHIYPQDDLAHHDKLQAFYQALQIPQTLQQVHNVWNGRSEAERPAWTPSDLAVWQAWSTRTQQLLQTQSDLSTQLIGFVAQKR
ncbi:elongation factor P maturation arginine rhamnosyltransferase EarP [Limnohabitans sp. B9-3]|uniref:elongation factor P maturation arginine rhamnosyltransferase EarP n=1 Tax=Limnohabitans sp. B9-3 TaxID=1100707 RepID=UPI000C1EB084|nr:elongation factor P maturation arginine rhamnosyltransferase EarP [Limnohabitans sp. B9-3]PIT77858.1 hypothetical protein B9Z42_03670 [Limnohabitans sp. B9-3]